MKTNAERQAEYRQRHLKDLTDTPKARINMLVDSYAKARLKRMAKRYGVTQQAMLERIIEEADKRIQDAMTPAEHAEYLGD